MLELSAFNVEKLIHSFVQHLVLQISPICNKKYDKINFTFYIDANLELLRIGEKLKEIATRGLDIDDAQNVHSFIAKQTKFFDRFVYSENIPWLAYPFACINKKMIQKVSNINKISKNLKNYNKVGYCKKKISKSRQFTIQSYKQVFNVSTTEKTLTLKQNHEDISLVLTKNTYSMKYNLTKSIIEHVWQETELNEKYLRLYVNNIEFIKRNICITLYVANQTLYDAKYYLDDPRLKYRDRKSDYQYMLKLCHHAILCLIDPSEKAFIYTRNNLSIIIQDYLSQGYVYHFNFASEFKNHYCALLILSEWAKPLVRHPDTIMLRTISAMLRCKVCDILTLSRCSDIDFL